MQKKMSEAGKAKATAFLKTLADVCIKNGDHALTTMECLVEITAEMEEIAARDKVPITAVMDAANLKKHRVLAQRMYCPIEEKRKQAICGKP